MAQVSTKLTISPTRQAIIPPPATLSADVDPTQEIRNLIEQLQNTSREARTRQLMAEEERDQISRDLAKIQAEMQALARLTKSLDEITAERDQLIEKGAKYGERIASLQHTADVAEKDRADAAKQRDDLTLKVAALEKQTAEISRVRDALAKEGTVRAADFKKARAELEREIAEVKKQAQDAVRSGGDSQKHILALRQARDATASQILDLQRKASATEDQLAEATYQLDQATKALATATAKYETQATELAASRSETAQTTPLRAENERLAADREREISEFTNRLDSLRTAHESELALARQQHESALKERDLARERALAMHTEAEQVLHETVALKSALSAAEAGAAAHERREVALNETLLSLAKSDETLRSRAMEADRRAEIAVRENRDLALSLDEARNSLIAAQNQLEFVIGDRDAIREKAAAEAIENEDAMKDAGTEIVRLKKEFEAVHPQLIEYAKLADRFEQQRLDTIELSAQLENAHRVIKEMGASLAESRLLVRDADRRVGLAGHAAPAHSVWREPAQPAGPQIPPQVETLLAVNIDNSARRELAGSMRGAFQTFTRRPGDLSLLNELYIHAQNFSELAKSDGEHVLHRVSSAFAGLLRNLHLMPEQVTPAMLRTVNQTIEFLASLLKHQGLDHSVILENSRVYAVDDDADICESVRAAIETVGLTIKTTLLPGEAVTDLAGTRYDLVILDVQLPELNGFELCTHIRNMALHSETPIVFLSGNASMENRVQSSLRGGNEFLSKPFNFHELGIKALTLILRAQLKMP